VKTLFRWLALTLVAVGCLAQAQAESLRIGTWNVRNYLLHNRWEQGKFRFDYPKPEAEKAALRRVLLQVRPDILLLQEIGSAAMLQELREDLAAAGLDYPHLHAAVAPGARGGLGLLSRLAPAEALFLDPVGGQEGAPLIRRGLQELVFHLGGQRLRVFNVHLKSRYTSDPEDFESRAFRAAELRALQAVLAARLAIRGEDEWLLLAGDFNTPFDDPLLEALRLGWQPLEAVDAAGEAWTYLHVRTDTRETIDGFWKPAGDAEGLSAVGVFPVEKDGPIGSDHRLVVVDWRP
jgi:endonuclease/exonuclease/phosphatase family metal-dependent hydrolase